MRARAGLDTPIEAKRLFKKLRFVLSATNKICIYGYYLFNLCHYYFNSVTLLYDKSSKKRREIQQMHTKR